MQFTPIKQLDRFRGVLAAQLLSSQTSGTFDINTASALGTQLATMATGYVARVTIEDEHILLSGFSVSGSTVTCTIASGGRGYNGTTAATHASDTTVECRWGKSDVDNINDHLLRFDDAGMIVPLGTVVPTITDANTLSFAGVDYTAYLPVGMVVLYKVVSTWYRATVTASSFSTNTTVEITGDGLPASGTVLNFGVEMSRAVHANKTYDLIKQCAAAPAENPPSGYAWFYLDAGVLKLKDSAGTVTSFDALPTTTKGDLIAYSTTNARLAVGSNNQVLVADSALTHGMGWKTLDTIITGFRKSFSSSVTAVTVSNGTTSEQNFFSVSVPAGALGTTNGLKGRVHFSVGNSNGATGTFTLRLKYGSTTVISIAIPYTAAGSTTGHFDFVLQANASASAQTAWGHFMQGSPTVVRTAGTGTATEASAGALNLILSCQASETGTNGLTMFAYEIENF